MTVRTDPSDQADLSDSSSIDKNISTDMVTHMKTTIDIADDLLLRAKEEAKQKNTTLKSLVERGLAEILEKKDNKKVLKIRSFAGGEGVNPIYEAMTWDEKLEVIYGNGSDRL